MFSKPMKPIEESSQQDDAPISRSLIPKINAILDQMTEEDYKIETVTAADGKQHQKIFINGKFLTDNLEKTQLKHNFTGLQHLIVTNYTTVTAMDFIFGKDSKRKNPIVTHFLYKGANAAKK